MGARDVRRAGRAACAAGIAFCESDAAVARPRHRDAAGGGRTRPRHGGALRGRRTDRIAQPHPPHARRSLPSASAGIATARHRGVIMRQIWLGANAVFRESVRDRVPYSIVVFAVLMIGVSYLISQLTAGQDMKIIKDLGLAALSIFGLLIAIF